jgi:hypothetical protein
MALVAFAVSSGEETRQVQVVCLDDLVPADDDLRRIEALVDWGQVRRTAAPFYRPGGAGRPGIDPAVVVKARARARVAWAWVDARDAEGRADGRVDPAILGGSG